MADEGKPRKTIDLREFIDAGYLHEVNRQFFHPLGLALAVYVDDDGSVRLESVWDSRDDPAGFSYADEALDPVKAAKIVEEQRKRHEERRRLLGWVVQPVDGGESTKHRLWDPESDPDKREKCLVCGLFVPQADGAFTPDGVVHRKCRRFPSTERGTS